jgi:hypothetical protein
MPLLEERIRILREAAEVLCKVCFFLINVIGAATKLMQEFDLSIAKIISDSNGSAARLVNLLTDKFPCFRDETKFEGKTVRFFKRAQIFAADLWAAFDGNGLGQFNDIDQITMFAGRVASAYFQAIYAHIHRLSYTTATTKIWCFKLQSSFGGPY